VEMWSEWVEINTSFTMYYHAAAARALSFIELFGTKSSYEGRTHYVSTKGAGKRAQGPGIIACSRLSDCAGGENHRPRKVREKWPPTQTFLGLVT